MSVQRFEDTYCANGCPFGSLEGPICMRSKYPADCPINKMYWELLEFRKGGKRCMYCSLGANHPELYYPANGCGDCHRFCPACEAPKD